MARRETFALVRWVTAAIGLTVAVWKQNIPFAISMAAFLVDAGADMRAARRGQQGNREL